MDSPGGGASLDWLYRSESCPHVVSTFALCNSAYSSINFDVVSGTHSAPSNGQSLARCPCGPMLQNSYSSVYDSVQLLQLDPSAIYEV